MMIDILIKKEFIVLSIVMGLLEEQDYYWMKKAIINMVSINMGLTRKDTIMKSKKMELI